MKQTTLRFTFAPIFICLFSLVSSAQLDEDGRWKTDLYYETLVMRYSSYSEADFSTALEKLKAIKSEQSSPQDNEWAGDYRSDGSLSVSLFNWSPNAGYVSIGIRTCQPDVSSIDYGSIYATDQYLLISSTRKGYTGTKLIPVKWGERHYLVWENQLAAFRDYVAGYGSKLSEGESGYTRIGDEGKPVADTPVYPRGYERFVKKPIDAVVTKILKKEIKAEKLEDGSFIYDSETTVKLNVGSANGVKRKMTFNVPNSQLYETIEIITVGKNSSTGFISRRLDGDKKETDKNYRTKETVTLPPIEEGMKLSTRPILQ